MADKVDRIKILKSKHADAHPDDGAITGEGLRDLYRDRFDSGEKGRKSKLWSVLVGYLQRYVPEDATVLDMGAGYCEFINHVRAARKIAVDLNPDTAANAAPGVEVFQAACDALTFQDDASVDVVFISNFLEHLADKKEVLRVLKEANRVTREGGRIIIIQPNIRLAFNEYWDYFDHHVALSDRSLTEAVKLAGYRPVKVIPAFLPFSTKGAVRQLVFLFRVYMSLPFLWRFFGKQTLVVAEKRPV